MSHRFDAYFDDAEEPFLLNTWKDYFASRRISNDRYNVTSKGMYSHWKTWKGMTGFLKMLAGLVETQNFGHLI
ncbi:MAG: hypothetical protein IPH88_18625 [Bacteroidales bacterium]|nr:hypothetical protein [Bacteroidales bacterium]